jgi:hypothetical protein
MTYATFAADVLTIGAQYAASKAARHDVPGATIANWFARLSVRAQRRAQVVAA